MSHAAITKYDRSNHRHRIMVEFAALGHTPAAIAEQSGYAEAYVRAVLRSPLFQTEVATAQAELRTHSLSAFARHIGEHLLPAATVLTTIASNTEEKSEVRLNAAKQIIATGLEMFLPKRPANEDRTVRLVLESRDLKLVADALTEEDNATFGLGSPDSLAAEMEAATAPRPRVRAMSIDEAATQLSESVDA